MLEVDQSGKQRLAGAGGACDELCLYAVRSGLGAMLWCVYLTLLLMVSLPVMAAVDDNLINDLELDESERAWLRSHPSVRFTGDPNWLPYEAFNAKGDYIGIVSEHLALITQMTGLHFEMSPSDTWTQSVNKAKQGVVDILSETDDSDLKSHLNFTRPYLSNPIVIAMQNRVQFVAGINTIKNKKIALIKDYGYAAKIRRQYADIAFVTVDDIQSGLISVSTGEVDALLCTLALCSYTLSELGISNVNINGQTEFYTKLALGVQKDQPELLSILNQAIGHIHPEQQQAILDGWMKNKFSSQTDYTLVYQVLAGATVLLMVFFFWNRRLSREICLRIETEAELKAVQADMRHTHQHLLLHRENTPLAVIEWNNDFEVTDWNPAAERIFGFNKAEAMGRHISDLILTNRTREETRQLWDNILNRKQGVRSFNQNTTKDGRHITCAWYNTTLVDEQGDIVGVASLAEDITDQKKAEDEIEHSRARFEAMFESISDAIIYADVDRNIRHINSAAIKLFGYSAAEFVGEKTRLIYANEEDYKTQGKKHDNKHAMATASAYQVSYRRKDGTTFEGETTGSSIRAAEGEASGYIGVIRDVSIRSRIDVILQSLAAGAPGLSFEAFLEDALVRLTDVFDCDYAFVGQLMGDGKHIRTLMVRANGQLQDNFEYALAGTPCADVLSYNNVFIEDSVSNRFPDDKMLVDMGMQSYFGVPLVSSGGDNVGILSVMGKNPVVVDEWAEMVLTIFATRVSIELERYLTIEALEQHRENLEAEVEQRTFDLMTARDVAEKANRSKSEFLSRMSHELRTPMNAILGFSQLLQLDEKQLNASQNDNLNEIQVAGHHLMNLINEVLDLAKIESGKIDLSMESVSLDEVVIQSIALIKPQLNARQLTLIDHVSDQGYTVNADATRLMQVLVNMLSNAVKYNREQGCITIDCECMDDQTLRVQVTDTGLGLSADNIAKLFTSFERLNASFNVEGTGIGLVITKYLIEAMGGKVGVESVVGEGTTFYIELVLVDEVADTAVSDVVSDA